MGAGNDYWGLSISGDNRQSWWQLPLGSCAPHWGVVQNGQAEWKAGKPSICGLKEFWLRIDMASHNPNPTLAVNAMQIGVGFAHNMFVQPRLVPGENELWLEAAEPAGWQQAAGRMDLPGERAGEAGVRGPVEGGPGGRGGED